MTGAMARGGVGCHYVHNLVFATWPSGSVPHSKMYVNLFFVGKE